MKGKLFISIEHVVSMIIVFYSETQKDDSLFILKIFQSENSSKNKKESRLKL